MWKTCGYDAMSTGMATASMHHVWMGTANPPARHQLRGDTNFRYEQGFQVLIPSILGHTTSNKEKKK